ncbi:hypothetical protein PP459_gp207 [Streptomyces phage Wakanda]|uniref:Tail assembly chaperone n=2 Tax=Wakandavirus TaxID=3044854 RepID=A0A6G8R338_9CAUD|nr:hypothetical protein PP459_gp207 [Streptomyces phage Wakanda]YP_010652345.1 hypothetical protein PP460_gp213 [Streptomyces phage Muntaha]QIN94027.1 hypothetical protein SEA_WAKANDA_34 [Streptomyces phage Wakanda]QIN94591.1 hypothetical protein SEA_MUNTAHA_34 [Streptomyces phage Muntaha]
MWKNFDELEENITVDELNHILDAAREQEYERKKFAAALKGIDLDEDKRSNGDTPSFDDIKRRAEAKARGMTEEQIEFADIGIAVVEEE